MRMRKSYVGWALNDENPGIFHSLRSCHVDIYLVILRIKIGVGFQNYVSWATAHINSH